MAQFCISSTSPNYDVCENYYVLTDENTLKSFFHFRKAARQRIEDCLNTEANTRIGTKNRTIKTASKALVRHLVWKKRWDSDEYWTWVKEFAPEIVLVMNSDATFILDIARITSQRFSIPLVMFNSEGYYFFQNDYMREESIVDRILFPLYQRLYRGAFREFIKDVDLCIHLNSKLKKDYLAEFGGEHVVLYGSSTVEYHPLDTIPPAPLFAYLGNLGFNRPSALMEVADVLRSINSSYRLSVYGKIINRDDVSALDNHPNIDYKGEISYNEVKSIIYECSILFHVESQEKKWEEALKYGFSTKIADSVSSGRPFIMYSSPNIAGAEYIRETGAGWLATNKQELEAAIREALFCADIRESVLQKAHQCYLCNHSIDSVSQSFSAYLSSVLR